MATDVELIVRLEKRLMRLEKLMGIRPQDSLLVHPKSWRQCEVTEKITAEKQS